jgi:hypothetical protein
MVLRGLVVHVWVVVIVRSVAVGVMEAILVWGIRAVVARAIVVALDCHACEKL